MSYQVSIKEEALADIQAGYDYYESQQAGLGERFLSALEERLSVLSEYPHYFGFIDSKCLLRDVTVGVFPYNIVYAVLEDVVSVLAVHPTAMRPRKNLFK